MKSRAHSFPFVALSFPNSKKVPIYCWVDRESFPVAAWRSRALNSCDTATFCTIAELSYISDIKLSEMYYYWLTVLYTVIVIIKGMNIPLFPLSKKHIHRNEQLKIGGTFEPYQSIQIQSTFKISPRKTKRMEYSTLSDIFMSSTKRILPILFADLTLYKNDYALNKQKKRISQCSLWYKIIK